MIHNKLIKCNISFYSMGMLRNLGTSIGDSIDTMIENSYQKATQKSLRKLDQLGIKAEEHEAEGREVFVYSIDLNNDNFQRSTSYTDYILNATRAMNEHVDAKPTRGVMGVNTTGGPNQSKKFLEITNLLYEQSEVEKEKMEKRGDWIWTATTLFGMSAGVAIGYGPSTEFATEFAGKMNEYSSYLAPVTGIAQLGISTIGTLAPAAILTLLGMVIGVDIAKGIEKRNSLITGKFFLSQIKYSQEEA